MTTKPIFVNQVTHVPVDWANNISALVYDVFGVATTLDGARKRLGVAGMSYQDPTGVNIKGGSIPVKVSELFVAESLIMRYLLDNRELAKIARDKTSVAMVAKFL
jgi:hypothetical protein